MRCRVFWRRDLDRADRIVAGALLTERVDLKRELHTTLEPRPKAFALTVLVVVFFLLRAHAFLPPDKASLPDLDARSATAGSNVTHEQHAAAESLKKRLGNASIEFDSITGS